MARQLTNVSGQTRTLQDSTGRWHVVAPDEVYTVDANDERYYQIGDEGETPIWEEIVRTTKTRTKTTTTDEEAS